MSKGKISKLKTVAKAFALVLINPHLVLLAIIDLGLSAIDWIADKSDDFTRSVGNWTRHKNESWPLFGAKLLASIDADKEKRRTRMM